ncbi:2-oxoacid:ferredoxin oxidoreductase subunit beta [Cryomorpha ignava]|uniref:2-oxoacid:ferredoxin oxidoreductase subunit beta n=1 Tax=Cryomorpha ignava TaxID=101383 RepID=A0A7K3WPK1_9FLAO|nr:2-oxoacid:ferredoxin oxidoreductase subunit beta [Cryomorpha ignava]NEN22961.1 2-oxoacid:ferredoxin oxidoreductase subunit beta [Cryomorpha ignava]
MSTIAEKPKSTAKDFSSDQEIRWCPGCGDYSILKQVQTILPEIGVERQNVVFISGIGCSSRFPYYMNTYGMHSIHGRAPAFASGLKISNPDLSVWVITGDGDALSIGGNHLIHLLRRNFNLNILLFNNEIYGLTKGQYSPTSPEGKVTKSTPMGSIDHPFNPLALAAGADGTFIARAMDRDPVQLRDVLREASEHKGTSLVEIYQNCNVFNDGAFEVFTDKHTKANTTIFVEHGKPMVFGENQNLGLRLDGATPVVVDLEVGEYAVDDLWVHDKTDRFKAGILMRCFETPGADGQGIPRPFGVFYRENRACYEDLLHNQIKTAYERKGEGDLDALLRGNNTWTIE